MSGVSAITTVLACEAKDPLTHSIGDETQSKIRIVVRHRLRACQTGLAAWGSAYSIDSGKTKGEKGARLFFGVFLVVWWWIGGEKGLILKIWSTIGEGCSQSGAER